MNLITPKDFVLLSAEQTLLLVNEKLRTVALDWHLPEDQAKNLSITCTFERGFPLATAIGYHKDFLVEKFLAAGWSIKLNMRHTVQIIFHSIPDWETNSFESRTFRLEDRLNQKWTISMKEILERDHLSENEFSQLKKLEIGESFTLEKSEFEKAPMTLTRLT